MEALVDLRRADIHLVTLDNELGDLIADFVDQTHDAPHCRFGSADLGGAYAAQSRRVEHQMFMLV
jgi:hypothetical protein